MKPTTIHELKQGNRATQKAIYYDHADRLMAIVLRYLGSVADAEEVIQDTFVRAFEKIDTFDETRGSFKSWTSKIAINFALMALRKKKQFTFYEEDLHAAIQAIPNEAEDQLASEDFEKIIDSLDEKYAVIFKLKAIEGFNHSEISEMLNIKKEASRTIFSRARKQLRIIFDSNNFSTSTKGVL